MSLSTFGKHAAFVAVTIAALAAGQAAQAQALGINAFACGPIAPPGQFGPFDYRVTPPDIKHRVEDFHFTPKVEQAIDGATGTYGGDIDYTLRAFPNNPRALLSISNYSTKRHTERIQGAKYATECYFERAIRFQPNDPMVRLVYAIYLKNRNRLLEVRAQLDEASRLRGDQSNFDFDYNVGLLYFDVGDYDKSAVAATRAYALGAPLPALQGDTFVIGGPGSFFLEAGRNLGPFLNSAVTDGYSRVAGVDEAAGQLTFGGGVLSLGNEWNPWLAAQGADL